uniref:Homeobox domain-containing protein n=1 Tax=Zea mays TaxID=4577 RepID=A0A804NM48_MAIZE
MDIVVEEGNVDVGNTAEPSYEVVARSGCSAQLSTKDTDEHELAIESEDSKVSVGNAAKQSHDVVGVGIDCIFNHAKVSTEANLGPQPDVIHLTSLDVPNESSQISSDADMVEQNKQDALDTLIRISQHKKPKKLNVARVVSEDYKCTPEDVQLIEYIKTLPGKQVVVDIDSAWLNRNDMECLFHGDIQLSGEALSAYIHCIRDEEHLLHREGGKVFLENTFISSLLKRDGDPKAYLLIDFSDHLQISVYVLGAVFLQLCQVLQLAEHPVVHGDASKCHFGPIVTQKLKEHFEKDPYPCHATKEGLAQELGLAFNQISKWFSATRHYSRVIVAKNQKYPGENTTENNSSAIFDGIQVIEPNFGLIDKPDADTNDMISEKLMVQINLNEGIEEDIPPSQYTTRCEEKLTMTQAAISREAGPPGYDPGENCLQAVELIDAEIAQSFSQQRKKREGGGPTYHETFAYAQGPFARVPEAYVLSLGIYLLPNRECTRTLFTCGIPTIKMWEQQDTVIAQFLSNPAQVGPSESPVLFSGTVGAASTFSPLASNDLPEISAMVPPPSTSANRLGSILPEPLNTGDALERYKQVAQKGNVDCPVTRLVGTSRWKFFTSKIMKSICDLDKTPGPGRQVNNNFAAEEVGNAAMVAEKKVVAAV